jgi:5-methylcytosine-specific restriction endonuclease McrA
MAVYREHLAGEDWQAIRADALTRAGHRCEECGAPWGLQVHHKTYERLGSEAPEDMICLCRDCHRKLHGINYA